MVANAHVTEVQSHLSRWLVRLRLSAALAWAVRGLAGGLAAGLGLSLVARWRPLLAVSTLLWLAIALALASGAVAMAIAYAWPRSRLACRRVAAGNAGNSGRRRDRPSAAEKNIHRNRGSALPAAPFARRNQSLRVEKEFSMNP